jgi:hypothetical protein
LDLSLATILVILTCVAPGVVFLGIWDHATGTVRTSPLATLAWAALVSSLAYVTWHIVGVVDLVEFADAYARGTLRRRDVAELVVMFPLLLAIGAGLGLIAVVCARHPWGEFVARALMGRTLVQLPNWLHMMRPMWTRWVILRTASGEYCGILTHLPEQPEQNYLGLEQALWRATAHDDWIELGMLTTMIPAASIQSIGALPTEDVHGHEHQEA